MSGSIAFVGSACPRGRSVAAAPAWSCHPARVGRKTHRLRKHLYHANQLRAAHVGWFLLTFFGGVGWLLPVSSSLSLVVRWLVPPCLRCVFIGSLVRSFVGSLHPVRCSLTPSGAFFGWFPQVRSFVGSQRGIPLSRDTGGTVANTLPTKGRKVSESKAWCERRRRENRKEWKTYSQNPEATLSLITDAALDAKQLYSIACATILRTRPSETSRELEKVGIRQNYRGCDT